MVSFVAIRYPFVCVAVTKCMKCYNACPDNQRGLTPRPCWPKFIVSFKGMDELRDLLSFNTSICNFAAPRLSPSRLAKIRRVGCRIAASKGQGGSYGE